jgi:hypothetical protein
MPLWLQICLPFLTAFLGFGLGRLGGAVDRRRQRREVAALRAPAFVMSWETGHRFRLSNVGDAAATNLRVDFGNEAYRNQKVLDFHEPEVLGPGESFTFLMTNSRVERRPDQVRVSCDELPDVGMPVAVPAAP